MFGLDIVLGVALLFFFVGGIIGILTSSNSDKINDLEDNSVDVSKLSEGDYYKERISGDEIIIVKIFTKNIRRRRYSLVKYKFTNQSGYFEILPTRYFLSNFIKKVN